MKKFFFFPFLLACFTAYGQNKDSLNEMEQRRVLNESFFKNITGESLPDFTAKNLSGISYSANKLKNGKVTFLSFWFESCAPCIAEIPNLNRLYSMTKDNSGF